MESPSKHSFKVHSGFYLFYLFYLSKRYSKNLEKASVLYQAIPPRGDGNDKLRLPQPNHIITLIIKSANHRGSISALS